MSAIPGRTTRSIERTLDRDYFMSAEDARKFGLVDEVITKRHPLEEKVEKLAPVSYRAAQSLSTGLTVPLGLTGEFRRRIDPR